MAGSALQTAMKKGADKVPDRQTKGALGQAVDRIASLTRRADKTKAAVAETGAKVVHTAETQGTLFLASMAEGYFGGDKLKVGGVDLRGPIAIAAQGYGLYESMSGKGGGHSLAIGNGLMGSWLASVAVKAGQKLKDKGAAPAPPTGMQGELPAQPTVQPALPAVPQGIHGDVYGVVPTGAMPAPPEVVANLAGPVREVTLTPEPAAPSRTPGRDGRFVRARSS
jgi:hypothetical protein